jgi:hypothetical protein
VQVQQQQPIQVKLLIQPQEHILGMLQCLWHQSVLLSLVAAVAVVLQLVVAVAAVA